MAASATGDSQFRHPQNLDLGSVLHNWVTAHNGRLWQTTEEMSSIREQTDCKETQIKSCFDHQRRKAKLALERTLETPEAFMSGYNSDAARTLKHFFATVSDSGYLTEAGKALVVESTGLSNRAIIDFFTKYRNKPHFARVAATIANMELSDPSTRVDTAKSTDISIAQPPPASSLTGPIATAPVQLSQTSATSPLIQVERVAASVSTTALAGIASLTTTQSSRKRKRTITTLQDGNPIFGWHRGRQVNLTTEVEPLLRDYPGVRSATCLS
jgi:hypothetical protein